MRDHERGAEKRCRKCEEVKPLTDFHRNKRTKDGLHYYCKPCNLARAKAWYKKNHDRGLETRRQYRQSRQDCPDYKQRHHESNKRWRKENPEKVRQIAADWREKNPEKISSYVRKQAANRKKNVIKRRLNLERATPSWANLQEMQKFYDAAQRLTKETGIQHHVDHIVPLQGENVCGLHNQFNLQVIPAAENIRKSNKFPMI